MRKITASLAVSTVILLVASSASAAGTTIESFGATVGATTINVSGSASFVDEPFLAAVDGTDPANHGKLPATDLTSATISRPQPAANSLRLNIGVGNLPPAAAGVPVVLYYIWNIMVTPPSGDAREFLILANRASSADAGNTDPDFKLWTCVTDPTTGTGDCTEAAALTGAFTETGIDINLPTNVIGAVPGSTISAGGDNISVITGGGAPGVGEAYGGVFLDQITVIEDYVVPGPTVQVGVAPAGTAAADVTLSKAGTFKTDGTFTATVPRPEAGSHVVAARVCYTAADCVLTSTDVTV
jgi:hypothetical protein